MQQWVHLTFGFVQSLWKVLSTAPENRYQRWTAKTERRSQSRQEGSAASPCVAKAKSVKIKETRGLRFVRMHVNSVEEHPQAAMTCVHSVGWFLLRELYVCDIETCRVMQVYPQSIEQTQVPQCFVITFHNLMNCKDRLCRQVIEVAPAAKYFKDMEQLGQPLWHLRPLTSRSSCPSHPLQSWPQKQSTAQPYKAHFPVLWLNCRHSKNLFPRPETSRNQGHFANIATQLVRPQAQTDGAPRHLVGVFWTQLRLEISGWRLLTSLAQSKR